MRYAKSLTVPRYTHTALRFTPEKLRREGNLLLTHLREKDGALIAAEGAEYAYAVSNTVSRLYGTPTKLFCYDAAAKCLYMPKDGGGYSDIPAPPTFLVRFYYTPSLTGWYAGSKERISYIFGTSATKYGTYTADTGIWFKERLFITSGSFLYYSQPVMRDGLVNRGNIPEGFGSIDLGITEEGDFRTMCILNDKLYLFRERGVTELSVGGSQLDFKALPVPYDCGNFVANSLAACGDKACFLTERGLYSFDGRDFTQLDGAVADAIEPNHSAEGCYCRGSYYALVTKANGERAIYVYDLTQGAAHWLNIQAQSVSAEQEVYFLQNSAIYRLIPQGLPMNGGACELECTLSLQGAGECEAEWLKIEGKGECTVSLQSEQGSVQFNVRANERVFLPRPLAGAHVSARITAKDASLQITALIIGVREEEEDED